MTNPFKDKSLTKAKLKKMIETARSYVDAKPKQYEYEEYEWHEPHHFNQDELATIENFTKKVNREIIKAFGNLGHGEFLSEMTEMDQKFASTLIEIVNTDHQNYYFLPFQGPDETDAGFIGVSPESASTIVDMMLREIEKQERKFLSELEETILMDVAASLVDALSCVFEENESKLVPGSAFKKATWPVSFHGLEDVALFDFEVSSDQGQSVNFYFAILSDILDPVVGISTKMPKRPTQKQILDLIMKSLHKAPMEITARIISQNIKLQDLLDLQKGDLLVLNKRAVEPIEILLNNQQCMYAYPAAASGRYAVLIKEMDKGK